MENDFTDALASLREQFVGQLDSRVAAIREAFGRLDPAAWQRDEAEVLHRIVHSLTGSAGTFGMQSVSDMARELEAALAVVLDTGAAPDAESWQAVGRALDHLERIAR